MEVSIGQGIGFFAMSFFAAQRRTFFIFVQKHNMFR